MSSRARRVSDDAAVEAFRWADVEAPPATPPSPARMAVPPAAADDQAMRLAALERDAFAKGYAQGERAGMEAAATRGEAMLRRMGQTLEELAGLRAEMIRRTERQMVQLVLAIAERVVHREITLDRGLLVGMARAALDRLGEQASATIRLHPEDYAAAAGRPGAEERAGVRVVADPLVNRGGCLVESDFGFMDVSADAQFRELARALLDDLSPSAGADDDVSHAIVVG
jgi:flagellar assembly protein FliH